MRELKAALFCAWRRSVLPSAQGASGSAAWSTYSGDVGRAPVFTARADQHAERFEADARLAYGVADPGAALTPSVGRSQAVPIFVNGVLYTSTARRTIVALDPATGREIWKHGLDRAVPRTAVWWYWPGDGRLLPAHSRGHN